MKKLQYHIILLTISAGTLFACKKNDEAPATGPAVSTYAGSGAAGAGDGAGAASAFNHPQGLAIDASGNLYVADAFNNKIRKISSDGTVSSFAGSGAVGALDTAVALAATFSGPTGVAVDAAGNVYVADAGNNKIRKITAAGTVSTLAGSGVGSAVEGTGKAATFLTPTGVAVDAAGTIFVADYGNDKIRKITAAGVVTTLAGNGNGTPGTADGTGTGATFNYPYGICLSNGFLYVSDYNANKIRKINAATAQVTTLAGSGSQGATDSSGTKAAFNAPFGVAADASGNVYVADSRNYKIRKISSGGVVTTLAGKGSAGAADALATGASFNLPQGVAVDASGNVFVADAGNNKIRKIAAQ